MKKMLLLSVLVVSSCGMLTGETGSLTRDGSSILLNNPGAVPMTETVMRVEGTDLKLAAPCEIRAPNVYGCLIGTVPGGDRYRLTPTSGTITKASANFYQGDGILFHRLELK